MIASAGWLGPGRVFSMKPFESRLCVKQAPMRPTLIYDGQCRFCICQVQRARRLTGDAVEYVASGASETAWRFPELTSARLQRSLQFILPDGEVYEGAHGVLRLLSEAGRFRRLLWLYERSRPCAALLEWGYRWVAGNRGWLGRVVPCSHGAGTRAGDQQRSDQSDQSD